LRDLRCDPGGRAGPDSPLSIDDVIDHIIAPIVYRVIFLPWTLSDDTAAALVERLFKDRL
jgi:hypothetical protein